MQGTAAGLTLLVVLVLVGGALWWVRPTLRMSLAAALWIIFVVYWSRAARHMAPTLRSESASSRALHTWLLNVSLLLLFVPVPGLRARFVPLTPSIWIAGLLVQALGILLAGWARHHLGCNWSGAVAVAVDHELVRSGPYRLVRHPIYSAMFVMYLGICLVSGEIHALVGLAVLAAAYWRKIPQEERTLRGVFGPAYDAYRSETWALVPGRQLAFALALVLLLALTWTGISGGLHQIPQSQSSGQKVQSVLQLAYGVLGLSCVLTTFWGRRWGPLIQIGWSLSVALAAGLASVVWGGTSLGIGLLSGGAALLIALAMLWLLRVGARGLTIE